VHSFVPPILLRAARLDALVPDPEPQPLQTQPAETEQARPGKRRTGVASNPVRQAKLSHRRVTYGHHMRSVHLIHYLAADQITAERVGDREWITPLAVTRTKPSLEIDAPDLVWGSYLSERLTGRRYLSPYSLRLRQTSSI
jgi:hypothetical protein